MGRSFNVEALGPQALPRCQCQLPAGLGAGQLGGAGCLAWPGQPGQSGGATQVQPGSDRSPLGSNANSIPNRTLTLHPCQVQITTTKGTWRTPAITASTKVATEEPRMRIPEALCPLLYTFCIPLVPHLRLLLWPLLFVTSVLCMQHDQNCVRCTARLLKVETEL